MSGKIALVRDRGFTRNPDPRGTIITMALPFYRRAPGKLVHRVRSGVVYRIHERPHMGFSFWCGNCGTVDGTKSHGELFAEAPSDAAFCATCEGRAIGAGLDGVREINGRFVLYSPRV